MGLFENRQKNADGKTVVPVWFMRQAGRYHSHYQGIKKNHNFMEMCKVPELAHQVTMGPIEDFKFDGAILFSDLLFPLEQLGLGLSYATGAPTLAHRLQSVNDLAKFNITTPSTEFYDFQKRALALLRRDLPQEKTLLGFVGAPFTLYAYAVEGSHAGNLTSSKLGLYDGRFAGFMEKLLPVLLEELEIQAQGGADALCLFDTAVGELSLFDMKKFIFPTIRKLTEAFKKKHPEKKVIYYSKHTHLHHLQWLETNSIDVLGVDWRMDLGEALNTLGRDYYIQGNIDPSWLHLPWPMLEERLGDFFQELKKHNPPLSRWICGLGHGVLVGTPEDNVRKTVEYIQRHFVY